MNSAMHRDELTPDVPRVVSEYVNHAAEAKERAQNAAIAAIYERLHIRREARIAAGEQGVEPAKVDVFDSAYVFHLRTGDDFNCSEWVWGSYVSVHGGFVAVSLLR